MSKLKKLEEKRNISINRISETYAIAMQSKANQALYSQFKSRYADLDNIFSDFESVHNKIISELDETSDFKTQDAIRKDVDNFYYTTKAIYYELFDSNLNLNPASSPANQKDNNAKLPKISIPTFDGNPKLWQTFIDLFKSLIHENSSLSDIEKFQYLLSFVDKEPLHLLKTIPITSINYKIAFDTLVKRYQNKRLLATTALNDINNVTIKHGSAKELRLVLDTFSENIAILRELNFPVNQWNFPLFNQLLQKIDVKVRTDFEVSVSNQEIPTYEELYLFLEKQCKALESVQQMPSTRSSRPAVPQFRSMNQSNNPKYISPSSFVNTIPGSIIKCRLCNSNHVLSKCPIFLNKNPNDRFSCVKRNNLCINCLQHAHLLKDCTSNFRCRSCNNRHHSLLHLSKDPLKSSTSHPSANTANNHQSSSNSNTSDAHNNTISSIIPPESMTTTLSQQTTVLLSTAVVEIRDYNGNFQPVRVLLDSASQANFISEKCLNRLGLSRKRFSIPIFGLNEMCSSSSNGLTECFIRPQGQEKPSFSFEAIVLPKLCSSMPSIKIDASSWEHIKNLPLSDKDFDVPHPVDILLGCELFPHILKESIIHGEVGQASAVDTVFGFILLGKIDNRTPSSNSISTYCTSLDSSLDFCLQRFWETEQVFSKPPPCPDDEMCERIFLKTVSRTDSGRFVVSLPFKTSEPNLGNTYPMAFRRFNLLESRLLKNPEHYQAYSQFMKDYLESNHMTLVPTPTLKTELDSTYFIPHHSVFRPKIRVVFDGSAKGPKGLSLNDTLFSGPKLQNDIRTILLNFRTHAVVFMADIKQMFRQILVTPSQTRFQNILWRFSINDPIETYSLNTVTYGLKSSPYLAIRTLQELAHIESNRFPEAAKVLLNDIYVDDILSGSDSIQSAISLQHELISLLNFGGFELKKWASNKSELLCSFPATDVQMPLSFDKTEPNFVKVLGLQWNPVTDSFSYRCCPDDSPCTKRNILSQIARIFDPCGFCSPILLYSKSLMQQLWISQTGWNEIPPQSILDSWIQFKDELPELSKLSLPRRIIPDNSSRLELHGFCDASQLGYAATIYFRVKTSLGEVLTFLVFSKSRVAPLKTLSIPRLELCGAKLLADLVAFVRQSYSKVLTFDDVFVWSDSQVVLFWLASSPHRWKTFIANRVTHIQEILPSESWHYISSSENPADCASRGLTPCQLLNHDLWWNGPPFLKMPRENWLAIPSKFIPTQDNLLLEERKTVLTVLTEDDNILDKLLERCSCLLKIQRILSYCLRFVPKFRKHFDGSLIVSDQELQNSMIFLVRHVQNKVFTQIISSLQNNKVVPKPFRKLSLFLDKDNCIRVGGRLKHSELSYDAKHPLLLPCLHRLTELVVEYTHNKYAHPGLKNLHYLLRQQFWILSARRIIQKTVSRCIRCFRTKPKTLTPYMGNLPPHRISQLKAFSHVGIDYCGPFFTTMGRYRGAKVSKAYICVFVCTSTKAIHLELASDLSSETFLSCFKRFVARRGRVSDVYTDCGTNFIGADKLLCEYSKNACESFNIKWHFSPPAAPHFNGLSEAGVKSVKSHLLRVVGEQRLTFEEFSTFLCQVESVLNSRPLYSQSSDPNDFLPLTPGHFLTLEPLNSLPEPDTSHLKLNSLSRWQLLQRLQSDFWKRWHLEYLNTLQQRFKWTDPSARIKENTLVILKNELKPPMQWALARVIKLHPGPDGHVRVVTVKTGTGSMLRRPIVKLCPLPVP